ncbi:MAG TPA: DUF4381 domain-containing protein [Chthoniobacter sp.]|nr:DUF4381 domain-containing protein [Chthoniobacter sp.]
MMNDPTSLDRLHDIVAPAPAPWWPLAPAWNWLLGLLLFLGALLALRALLRWQRNRYRREALAELSRQERALFDISRRAQALTSLAELLKRAALSAWPRAEVASLTGSAWSAFLDRTGGTTAFSKGLGSILEQVSYDPRTAAALDESALRELAELVRHWLVHHRREVA